MEKIISLKEAVSQVQPGSIVALGGNVLHRSPVQAVLEIARQGIGNLHLVKTAIATEADLLCGMDLVSKVSAGFVSYEAEYGLCHFYRKGVEQGQVIADEHACYSVITALRAAVYGVPFLPIRGFLGSSLIEAVGFQKVKDPYTQEELIAIKAIQPDVAFVHVQKADRRGNCEIIGPLYEDLTIVRAARKVFVTCEELLDDDYFGPQRKATIPEVLVSGVIPLKYGSKPSSCPAYYGIDHTMLQQIKQVKTKEDLANLIAQWEESK